MSRTRKRVKQFFKTFRELIVASPLSRWTLLASFLIFLAMLALPIWRVVPLASTKPFIPLHYNIYFGVDRFGPWEQAFVIPALGLLFWFISAIMQTIFFRKEKLLVRFFAMSTVFIELIFLVAIILLILLNI